jgi:hypothetical protein
VLHAPFLHCCAYCSCDTTIPLNDVFLQYHVIQNLIETLNDTEGSIVWGLYFHLWKKTHKGLPCPDINLPHTVSGMCLCAVPSSMCDVCMAACNSIHATHMACAHALAPAVQVLYQDSRPIAWYFTSVKENKVRGQQREQEQQQ